MRMLQIINNKVVSEFDIPNSDIDMFIKANSGMELVEDTFGEGAKLGMLYTQGVLSGDRLPLTYTLVKTPEQIKQEITSATSIRLDTFAKTRNYDSILSACTYATSQIPQFAKEGQYCVSMRDATWGKLYQIMQEVEAGTRPMPTGYADIESELPVLDWANA